MPIDFSSDVCYNIITVRELGNPHKSVCGVGLKVKSWLPVSGRQNVGARPTHRNHTFFKKVLTNQFKCAIINIEIKVRGS